MAEITPTNTYKIIRPTIWQRLGFGTCLAPDVEPPRLATRIILVLDWRDRLRVLLSGRIMVAVGVEIDEPVRAKASLSRMSVLPPSSDSVQSEEPPK